MSKAEEYIEKVEHPDIKEFYQKGYNTFSHKQKIRLDALIDRLEAAGAKKPLPLAFSEINEGIPQFGRFLVLRRLFTIINTPEDNIAMAEDLDEDMEDTYATLEQAVGKEKLQAFLRSYGKGMGYTMLELIEGNIHYKKDKVTWALTTFNERLEPTRQIIQGLSKSFGDFEDET